MGGTGRIVAIDGARTLGAKILVAGGGRCNVTHHAVDETAYCCGPSSSKHTIRNILRGYGVERTVEFFAERGVELKQEDTGKLFPVTDSARTVLDALLDAAQEAGVELVHPWRAGSVERAGEDFVIRREGAGATSLHAWSEVEEVRTRRVILATGGKSLPKSGSDGAGYEFAKSLGHTVTPEVFPALVPLVVDPARTFVTSLSGLTLPATLDLWSSTAKRLTSVSGSLLLTHFGLSGPAALDISRHFLAARVTDADARLTVNFAPGRTLEEIDKALAAPGAMSIVRRVSEAGPVAERLARAICQGVGVDPSAATTHWTREQRRAVSAAMTALPLPVTGDRGFTYAEVTAGGVPLGEVQPRTMSSRVCPGLFLAGEILDVDGRIGGFNFQWAWATGHAAGVGAAMSLEG